MKIHLLGPSGSGTSSLGNLISQCYKVVHLDSDDLFWADTDIPYTQKRSAQERTQLLKSFIKENQHWVISGSALGWGDILLKEALWIITEQKKSLKI
jgi:adenylate kinase family enzyme